MQTRSLRSTLAVAVSALTLAFAAPVDAQQTGIITGVVMDATSQQTLESAQIFLPSLLTGALTNARGRYIMLNVPVGTHEISVELIGYSPATQTVTVVAGQTVQVDFRINSTALRLQELVVTGVAGSTPRVKLPFTVEKLDVSDMPVPSPSVDGMITGKVSGAKVTKGSGQPGEDASIMLRGPTTITGSQSPLIIVDGVITDNTLADIGSLDVESIEIVKGAAAASLYGSRASNGVVQIRTKRGENLNIDESRVIVRSEYGIQNLEGTVPRSTHHWFETDASGNILDVEGNVVQNLLTHKEVTGNNVSETLWHDKAFPSNIPTYNQLDQFFSPGNYYSQYAAVEGRTGMTNYRASLTYQDEEGVLPDWNDGFQLKGFRLNVDHQVRDAFNVSMSTYYAQSDQEDIGGSPFYALAHQNPFVDLLRRDPNTIGSPWCPEEGCLVNVPDPFNQEENPLYSMEILDRQDARSRFLGSVAMTWSPKVWFELEGNFSLDRSDRTDTNLTPKGYETEQSISLGSVQKQQSTSNDINGSLTASLNKAFGDLTTRTRLRYLMEDQHYEYFDVTGTETQAYGVPVLDNTATYDGSSSIQDVRSEGYFFISALDYQGKYMGDVLVRRDGSSLFGPDERWQTYYRASGAWRLAQEEWWPFDNINELKLRYSIGTAGGRPRFASQYETYSVSSAGIFPRTLGNKKLKPELATEQEVAIEGVLFNKISAGVTYAWNDVEDQLIQQPLLSPVGFSSQWVNGGALKSNTYEAFLETSLIETADMGWVSRVSFDRTRQEISRLDIAPYRTGYFYVREGEVLGTFYGSRWATECSELGAGADCSQYQVNDDGYLVWTGGADWSGGRANTNWFTSGEENGVSRDWGMPIKAIDDEGSNFLRMGNTTPRFNLRWSNSFRWKNLSVYALLDGEFGADVYNQTRHYSFRDEVGGEQDQYGKPEELKKPIPYYQLLYNVNANSSHFVEDGTFVKLREASIRYQFDREAVQGWFGGVLGLDGLSINVMGRNLLTFTDYLGYDPESGTSSQGSGGGSVVIGRVDDFGYPNFRTISVSIETIF